MQYVFVGHTEASPSSVPVLLEMLRWQAEIKKLESRPETFLTVQL